MNHSKNKFEAKSLKDVLKEVVDQKPLQKGVQKVRICNAWGEVMGKNILNYTDEVRFSYNILYVSIRSAPLKMELSYELETITKQINAHLGGDFIKKIVLH